MSEKYVITPTSHAIADAIAAQMRRDKITPTKLEQLLEGKVFKYTIRRIRKGSSGCFLRNYEDVLAALGLRLAVVPINHVDILD